MPTRHLSNLDFRFNVHFGFGPTIDFSSIRFISIQIHFDLRFLAKKYSTHFDFNSFVIRVRAFANQFPSFDVSCRQSNTDTDILAHNHTTRSGQPKYKSCHLIIVLSSPNAPTFAPLSLYAENPPSITNAVVGA